MGFPNDSVVVADVHVASHCCVTATACWSQCWRCLVSNTAIGERNTDKFIRTIKNMIGLEWTGERTIQTFAKDSTQQLHTGPPNKPETTNNVSSFGGFSV